MPLLELEHATETASSVALRHDYLKKTLTARVYDVARTIPPGRTLTYGDIARRLGDPAIARDVGQALGKNPFAIVVPCHRVLAAGGKLGGFSAVGGVRTKRRMLEIEHARAGEGPDLFDLAHASAKS